MQKNQKSVACVLVTYNPDIPNLVLNLLEICHDVSKIFVIDNSITSIEPLLLSYLDNRLDNFQVISNYQNLGIGAAQNIGLHKAINEKYDYALLLDQDTLMPSGSIKVLSNTLSKLLLLESVAAIAPSYRNINHPGSVRPKFIVSHDLKVRSQFGSEGTIEIAYAIASGLLINLECLSKVGMMNESLFIDWVDTEWCVRCTKRGFKVFGTFDVIIEHSLGDSSLSIAGIDVAIHSPLRHYYQVRNAIHLALYSNTFAVSAKIRLLLTACKYFIAFSLYTNNRKSHFLYMCFGLCDGLLNKLGKFSHTSNNKLS